MKKYCVYLFIASIVLAGCQSTPPAPVVPPESRVNPAPTIIPTQPNQPTKPLPLRSSEGAKGGTEPTKLPVSSRTIDVSVRNWAFSPANISAKKGEKITLRLHGESGIHGFAVPDLGINQPVRPGETISVELPTDASGTYRFFCSIPCGQGHIDMKGVVTVEE